MISPMALKFSQWWPGQVLGAPNNFDSVTVTPEIARVGSSQLRAHRCIACRIGGV